MSETIHVPVLMEETLQWLAPAPGGRFVDGTLGGGGHARALAVRVGPAGLVLAVDRDRAAVERARQHLPQPPCRLEQASFRDLPEVLRTLAIEPVDGVLLDLGLSSDQLADAGRGFSFDSEGELDLRFDTSQGEPAWRLLDRLSERHLADLIYEFGEERLSRRIARRIVASRERRTPVRTARELARLIQSCSPPQSRQGPRIHPATRTFQALRIAVNEELEALDTALRRLPEILRPGGRAAIISFHSLEDRRVKQAFRDDERYTALTRKPVRPTEAEVESNPRCRSARLRVAERVSG